MAKNIVALTAAPKATKAARKGLRFGRYFTPEGSHAFDLVEWERRTAAIIGEKGQVIFEQKDVEVPRAWSQLAINVVAQKYFRGGQGTPERETSVRQIIDRVVETLAGWGREGGYFASEEDAVNWAGGRRYPPGHSASLLQQPGVVQHRRARPSAAGVGVLHQLGAGLDGVDPRAGQDRRHAVQVRQRHRHQPVRAALLAGAAVRWRHRL